MMCALQRPLTYEDLLDAPDDGKRREIVGGELIVNPAPTPDHQRALRSFFRELDAYIVREACGEAFFAPIDVLLNRFNIVQPDLAFVSRDQANALITDRGIEGAPTLIAEVVSPGSSGIDRVRKMALYAEAGVREYWIVDPRRRLLEAFELVGDGFEAILPGTHGAIASRVLPGLAIDPAVVFADLF